MEGKNIKKVYVGIDVSRDTLDVFDSCAAQYMNSRKGIESLVKRLLKLKPELIVLESTGGYEKALMSALWSAGLVFSQINPKRAKSFARSLGLNAKNDAIDAKMLALFADRMNPPPTVKPAEHTERLRALYDRQRQLTEILRSEKNRLASPIADKGMKKSIRTVIKTVEKELKNLASRVESEIEENQELKLQAETLQAETGVGPILTLAILADMPELGALSREKAAALVGVAPYNNQSGARDGKRYTRGGRKNIRSVLYMATLSAIRHNQRLKVYYLKFIKAGKPKMVALVATMRRFICILNQKLRYLRTASANLAMLVGV